MIDMEAMMATNIEATKIGATSVIAFIEPNLIVVGETFRRTWRKRWRLSKLRRHNKRTNNETHASAAATQW